jgi:Ca-activated chloride channel family protein
MRSQMLVALVCCLVIAGPGIKQRPLHAQQAPPAQQPKPQQPPPIQGPTIKSAPTVTVPVYVTVLDPQRRLVPGLVREDFQVFDNEKPQPLALFDNQIRPITVVIMLDTSGSMTLNIELVKQAAEQFVIRLLPQDKARVGAFNDKIELDAAFTNDRDKLASSIHELDFGNGTRLWDAVDICLDALETVDGRKVIVLFTDGEDTQSKLGLGKVLDRARANEVMIYGIGFQSEFQLPGGGRQRTKPDRGLKKIADETGGGYFELNKADDLGSTFTRVEQELHSQYLLGFAPPQLDSKIHKLEVRMTQPGMTARARKSYVASPEPSPQNSSGTKPSAQP